MNNMLGDIEQQHQFIKKEIEFLKEKESSLINMLASDEYVLSVLDKGTTDFTRHLFLDLVHSQVEIMQLRLLSSKGMEIIRVDRLRNGDIKIIPNNELQNKSNRYYFLDFMNLPPNVTGYSPLDLNVEQGMIEYPFNPTLRVGTRIQSTGGREGVIVVNLYMEEWIKRLTSLPSFKFYLLDKEGFYLIHPQLDKSWSRYRQKQFTAEEYWNLPHLMETLQDNKELVWVNKHLAGIPIDILNHRYYAVYELDRNYLSLLFRSLAEFAFITVLTLILILGPIILILVNTYHRLISEQKGRQEDSIIMLKSKLEAQGEMLGAIAHQWRQPLNSIGLIIQDLFSAYRHNSLGPDLFITSKKEIFEQLNFLSETIDTFRNFFTKDISVRKVNLYVLINEILHLYQPQLKAREIETNVIVQGLAEDVEWENNPNLEVMTLPADIKQIVLIFLSNSRDAISSIKSADEKQSCINIEIKVSNSSSSIAFIDWAGGIPDSIKDRIFEPYFTSREMGTGLGLFIALTMTKNRLKGSLIYESFEDSGYRGSKFILEIPKNTELID